MKNTLEKIKSNFFWWSFLAITGVLSYLAYGWKGTFWTFFVILWAIIFSISVYESDKEKK